MTSVRSLGPLPLGLIGASGLGSITSPFSFARLIRYCSCKTRSFNALRNLSPCVRLKKVLVFTLDLTKPKRLAYTLSMEVRHMVTKSTVEQGLRTYQRNWESEHKTALGTGGPADAIEYVACAFRAQKDSIHEPFLADAKAFLASARNEELNENYEQCFKDLFSAVDSMFFSPVGPD